MAKMTKRTLMKSESGITMIETLMAASILIIGSLGMIGLIVGSIASNNRNKIDSTQTMLAEAILEQVNSTFNGTGTSSLKDCANTIWNINTTIPSVGSVGARLSGASIDFTETAPPAGYFMNYVVTTPCQSTPSLFQGTYDVRWHLDQVGSTDSYLLTVGARLKNHGEGNLFFSLPVTLRVMSGV
jgi:type II secretory pathway pseudopilin PulG